MGWWIPIAAAVAGSATSSLLNRNKGKSGGGSGGGLAPQTPEGKELMQRFVALYGPEGALNLDRTARQLAGQQDRVFNAQPTMLNFKGARIPILSPFARQQTKTLDSLLKRTFDPPIAGAMDLEKLRYGARGATTSGGSSRSGPEAMLGPFMNLIGKIVGAGADNQTTDPNDSMVELPSGVWSPNRDAGKVN